MKTIKALVESDLPVEKVVEVTLPLTRRAKPEYKGNAHVKLRVDFAMGNGWGGIATVDGREIKITGPYGTQSKVPGLTVPAGCGRGEWEWSLDEGQSQDSNDTMRELLTRELSILTAGVWNTSVEERDKWMWYWVAQQALDWALNPEASLSPSSAIDRNSPANRYKAKQKGLGVRIS